MATAGDIVNRALRLIGIVGIGRSATAEEMQEGLGELRDMLADWELQGVRLGALVGVDLAITTTIPLPASHRGALQRNLAVLLAPEYGRTVEPALAMKADEGFRALQAAYLQVPEMRIDPALRGTYYPWGYYDV